MIIAQSSLKGLQIEGTGVENLLDLSHTHIERVLALGIKLGPKKKPPPPKRIVVTGLTYGDLEPVGVDDQLKLLIQADPNDTQAYSQLEDYYRLHGLPEPADTVFIQRKQAERSRLSWSTKWFSFLEDYTVGYGRRPERALYWSLGFVLLGALIFREADMVSEDPRSRHLTYNSFWYSLDLLTPLIDLDAAKVWVPSKNCGFKRNYARFHRIIGWILVPIGIAAITGIIK